MDGPGAGQVGSMMPNFKYNEQGSGVYSGNEKFDIDHTSKLLEQSGNTVLLENPQEYVKQHAEMQATNSRLKDYKK